MSEKKFRLCCIASVSIMDEMRDVLAEIGIPWPEIQPFP